MSMCRTSDGKAKRRWTTRAAAKAAMRQQAQCQGIDNTDVQPYRCDQCSYFHIGHYPSDPDARAGLRARHRDTQ